MRKIILFQCVFYALMALVASCTTDVTVQEQGEVKEIVMTAQDFVFTDGSRTNISVDKYGGKFTWAKDDTVGIFPDKGAQAYFPMINGAGTNQAYFDGGGWALKHSSTYAAYYPFIKSLDFEKTAIPISYEGQFLNGNASTSHLGKYDFMVAKASTPESGGVNFDFQHLGCLMELNLTVSRKTNAPYVILSVPDALFITQATVDLTSNTPTIIPTKTSSSITLEVNNLFTSVDGEMFKIYFMMAPVDLTGKTININVGGFKGSIEGKKFLAGHAYSSSAILERQTITEADWVDLGLSVEWASHNVGTTQPWEYGDYFAWGEIDTKPDYAWYNCLTLEKKMSGIAGDIRYDAATVNWGAPARMPTLDELNELINKTTHEWTTMNGIYGMKITGPNGKSIFLPAAGLFSGASNNLIRYSGLYWSATPFEGNNRNAYYGSFNSGGFSSGWNSREYGCSVRPVRDKK